MTVALFVQFDINQSSERLNYQFLRDGFPIVDPGKSETGLLSLQQNDVIMVTVNAVSDTAELLSISVLDCHVLTRPILYSQRLYPLLAGTFPLPSPFFAGATANGGSGANTNLGYGEATGDASSKTWQSDISLNCNNVGHWNMSFMITVAIERANPASMDYRVFTFDPETQVGTGAVPK